MLDLISHGRAQFGIGEGATRLELGGFGIEARRKTCDVARIGR